MSDAGREHAWTPGTAPVAVVMLSLNEGHNMAAVLENLKGWAQEVFLVDSYSADDTVDIALAHGVRVVQRKFSTFGDQWNFALSHLPIRAPWTLKLDPDERLSDEAKRGIESAVLANAANGFTIDIQLWFMTRPLPIKYTLLRLWRTGQCRFTDVMVNEHALVDGHIGHVSGALQHQDSPDLEHWLNKQNKYTSAEAIMRYQGDPLADEPRLFGSAFQRRMWMKKNFYRLPLRYLLLFLHYWIGQGAWRAGWVGYAWARLRSDVMRLIEFKTREMEITGRLPAKRVYGPGKPHSQVEQAD